MSSRSWIYLGGTIASGAILALLVLTGAPPPPSQLSSFALLLLLASVAEYFGAETPSGKFFTATALFHFAGILLLHPYFLVLLIVPPLLLEWARSRLTGNRRLAQWYKQPFNIAMCLLAAFAALWVGSVIAGGRLDPSVYTYRMVLGVIGAAFTHLLVSRALFVGALWLVQGIEPRRSGLFDVDPLLLDCILLMLGYVFAILWTLEPWLAPLALLPLALLYRVLMIPQLKLEAQTDAKTGLLNAQRFMELFAREFETAQRNEVNQSFIMADLDLLRNINNTYGHLAGDAVLVGIAGIIRDIIRDDDIAGRFGGEEFTILLPNVDQPTAMGIAERIRQAVEEAEFVTSTSSSPIRATLSLGVATFPQDATTLKELIHQADVAVYRAKLQGRNCVVAAADVPHSFSLAGDPGATDERVPAMPFPLPPRPSLDGNGEGEPADSPADEGEPEHAMAPPATPRVVWTFVYGVILMALVVTGLAFASAETIQWKPILVFTGLALLAEWMQFTLYDEASISVSMAFTFALALLAGVPGVAAVSAVIALTHYVRRRPPLYKTVFNYALHLLAGTAPVLVMGILQVPLTVGNLLILAIPVEIAALAYFLIESGLLATVVRLTEGGNIARVWDTHYRWVASHWVVLGLFGLFLAVSYEALGLMGVVVLLFPLLMMRYTQKQYIERTEDAVRELKRLNQELNHANQEILTASQSIKRLNDELFLTLAKIIDARDPYVSNHAAKVAEYAVAIAREVGITDERLEHIRQAGFLHDIGKLGIPESILFKPSRLSDTEYEFMKTHAALGAEFLQTSRGLYHLAPIVRHHHERWDGQGYPDRLRREAIPLEARILAVSDAVEAMASDRPYQPAKPLEEIVLEMQRAAGTQFDPNIVEAFFRVVEREGSQLVINSAREVQKNGRKGQSPRSGSEPLSFQWA